MSNINQGITLGVLEQRIRHDEEPQLLKGLVQEVGIAALGILLTTRGSKDSWFGQFFLQLVQLGLGDFVGVGDEVDGLVDHAVAAEGLWLALQLQADLGGRSQLSCGPEQKG